MRRPVIAAFCAACALAVAIPGLLTPASAADSAAGPAVVRREADVALPVDRETLEWQYRALSSMPSVEVVYSALGPVRTVRGATGIELSRATRDLREGQEAPEVLQKFKDVLLAAGSETLKVRLNELSPIGRTIRMDEFINGIPVLYGAVSVGVDDATGLVDVLAATFLPDRGLPRQPKLSAADAAKRVEHLLVERGMAKAGSAKASTPTLAYTGTHPDSTRGHLIWAVPARFAPTDSGAGNGMFWIDAIDGAYVGSDALSKHNLAVYTGNNTAPSEEGFPDNLTLLFNHPGSSTDQIVMNAYNNALDSLQAAQVVGGWVHNRALNMVVHYAAESKEASHLRKDGVDYMLFADGITSQSMGSLGNSRDAVAHEYGHAMSTSMFGPFSRRASGATAGSAYRDAHQQSRR